MAVTLKDVARHAQVSPTAVSAVLHKKANGVRVSDATAERVRQAARELGYRVNVYARNFRAQQTMMIGVLNGLGLERPRFNQGPRYFATLMDGIVEGAFRHGYSVALCPQLLGEHPEQAMSDGRFDGLVWYSIAPSEVTRQALAACSVPVVIVHARAEDFDNRYPTTICDNAQGVGLAVDHLVGLGHRRIAFAIEDDAMNVESLARLEAFKAHMARHGLAQEEADIITVHRDRKRLHEYLAAPVHTAIIAHADGLAGEIIEAAPSYGIKVPDDLSVVGFDSTEYCEQLRPPLTSISQPLFDLGARAVDFLIQAIDERPLESLQAILPCGLDIRGSTTTAPPR